MEMNSARLELTPSNPKAGIVTLSPYYQRSKFFFFTARARRATLKRMTQHAQHSKRGREAVMTDDGSQPPMEQLATAVHRGSATRSC